MKLSRSALLAAAVVALTLVAGGRSLGHGYVWDGARAVAGNRVVQQGSFGRILLSDYWRGTGLDDRSLYRPVTVASFALERRIVGRSDPAVSHGVNLALHAGVALLLAAWAVRIGASRRAAATAALLFTVHPVTVHSVVNLVGRAELLAAGFSLAALWCWTHAGAWPAGGGAVARPSPGVHRLGAWGTALLLLLALGSKEIAVATPFLILGQELLFRRQYGIERLATLAPCGLAMAVWVALRTRVLEGFLSLQRVPVADNVVAGLEGTERLATALAMAGRYAKLLLWPTPLSADYSGAAIASETSFLAALPLAGVALLLGPPLFALLVLRRRGASRGASLALAALLFLLPYLVIGNLIVPTRAGFALRLVYFPAAGLFVAVGMAVAALWERLRGVAGRGARALGVVIAVAALVGSAVWAREQSRVWRDDETLLRSILRAAPGSLRGHYALAEIHMDRGEEAEALRLYEAALRRVPDHPASWLYKGVLFARRGDFPEAEAAIRRALELRGDVAESHMFLGRVLFNTGRVGAAERSFRKALLYGPGLIDAAADLARTLAALGRHAEAAFYYRSCVERGREDLRAELRRAEALAAGGR
jgi:tetratricopeptide (TPR) repeat protein